MNKFRTDYDNNIQSLRRQKFDLDKLVSDEFVKGRQTYITRINEFLDSSHNQVQETIESLEEGLERELAEIVGDCELLMDTRQVQRQQKRSAIPIYRTKRFSYWD